MNSGYHCLKIVLPKRQTLHNDKMKTFRSTKNMQNAFKTLSLTVEYFVIISVHTNPLCIYFSDMLPYSNLK